MSDPRAPDYLQRVAAGNDKFKRALAQARRTGDAADMTNAEREAASLGLSLNAATIIFGSWEPAHIEEEIRRIEMEDAVGHLIDFCRTAVHEREQRIAEHHNGMIYALADFYAGDDNLMILAPPGCGKTTYVGELFPAWLLRKEAGVRIILAAASQKLAEHQMQSVQKLSGGKIDGRFLKTDNGGELMAVGEGTPLAGFRADYIIIDDFPRVGSCALSATARDRLWNWYLANLDCRRKPNGRTVLVASRWHEDDLAGRITQRQAEHWRVVEMSAHENRRWLWDDDPNYPYGKQLREIAAEYQRVGNLREWNALYQQDPRPGGKVVRAWDLAATEPSGSPDTTAGILLEVAHELERTTARLKEALAKLEAQHSVGSAIDREHMASLAKRVNQA